MRKLSAKTAGRKAATSKHGVEKDGLKRRKNTGGGGVEEGGTLREKISPAKLEGRKTAHQEGEDAKEGSG